MCFCLLPVTGFKFKFSFAETSSGFVILDNFTSFWTILLREKCCTCGFRIYSTDFDKFLAKRSVVNVIFGRFWKFV